MDNKYKILINKAKNIDSVNTDTNIRIELTRKSDSVEESEYDKNVSSTDVFNSERESNNNYRIYGSIEYMSMLNGIKNNLSAASRDDYFITVTGDTKSLLNSFEFYLLKPKVASAYSGVTASTYTRYFDVIAKPEDFDVYNAGFSKNVYGDQKFSFVINKDIKENDLEITINPDTLMPFGKFYERNNLPVTELFIYAKYLVGVGETMQGLSWDINGNPITGSTSMSDYMSMDMSTFSQSGVSTQINYINTPYIETGSTKYFSWYYSPMIPVRINMLSDELFKVGYQKVIISGNTINSSPTSPLPWSYDPVIPIELGVLSGNTFDVYSGTTSYDLINSMPEHAYNLGDGNFVWRNILPQNYINPVTSVTLNNPFMNGNRYIFSSIILDVKANKGVLNTANLFSNIGFNFQSVNNVPVSDINDIGKPCK